MTSIKPCVVVVMGVSGSGKTTIGKKLAEELRVEFVDADDFHPPENVSKMQSGEPLNDDDRRGWLLALRRSIDEAHASGRSMVLACSALKAEYREVLGLSRKGTVLVYLRATLELVEQRIKQRHGHFMPAVLARSQFATLEEPEDAISVDAAQTPEQIVQNVVSELEARRR